MPLSAGVQLGAFKIIVPIGAGGMGEVYRATDTKLDREVAIKILPASLANDPERLARFTREAKLLASMNHPNIATVFGVEEGALIMELIEGDTLAERVSKGPIPGDEAMQIAIEIASALEYAHSRGVVHRDLKPANVIAASKVKVLDFGLAKVTEKIKSDATTACCETRIGAVLGTAPYMSPEQAAGKPVDARSDVFSFGVLLYEMLSGQRAFSEESPISTMAAILHKQPSPLREIAPAVPPALESVVTHCMQKEPSARPASMSLVKKALKELGQVIAAPAEIASIAVLPFANHSADKENEYFSDGLAEEILIALSRVEGLRVTARGSSFSFKGKAAEMSEIAAKLHVAHILDGSVRRSGNRVRVTVQLVEARNGFPLWSERYDRQMEDIFEVQDEIAHAIADQLKVTLGVGVKQSTKNLEAYELYLKGRHLGNQRLPVTVRQAIQSFERAIQLDPEFALAYAGLADCYGVLRVYGWISAREGRPPALAAMTRAVALASNLSEVIFSRAVFTFYFGERWRDAGPDFEKAVARNPQSSLAHGYLALFHAMCLLPDKAMANIAQACKLDPVSPFIHGIASQAFHLLGIYDSAEIYARKALDLQPNYVFGMWMLGLTLCSLGRHPESIEALEQVVTVSRTPAFIGMLGGAYCCGNRAEDGTRLLNELEERRMRGELVPALSFLGIHSGSGDLPKIRQTLAESIAESWPALSIRITSPFLFSYRTDPEINSMLKELLGY